jgi:APA family basic amino acid/polyamine antiporter
MTTTTPARNNVFRRLPVEEACRKYTGGRHQLRQVYRRRDLIVLGLGVMIGAGIFRIAGVQAATTAGPAVVVSFAIAGIVCLLCAFSYAELSSTIPAAGSAYSFAYVVFGELWAWIIGWALLLELQLAASVVARVWSINAAQLLNDLGVPVPSWLAGIIGQESGFDLFTLVILAIITVVVASAVRLGLRALWFMVAAKVLVILFLIAGGLLFFDSGNLQPFVPPPSSSEAPADPTVFQYFASLLGGAPQNFGLVGIFVATPVIAFAYIGFDLTATAAEETEDAPRKVPFGMIGSLLIAIVLYIGVALVMVAMVPYRTLNPGTPLATAFRDLGADRMGLLVSVGAVMGLTTVILVVMVAQSRVVFAMARDGLLPRGLSALDVGSRAPTRAALVIGGMAMALSQSDVLTFGLVSALDLEQMIVIGTLAAFLFVSIGVLALRVTRPDLKRGFRVPGAPVTPVLAILGVLWLLVNLRVITWVYFLCWMAIGVLVYLLYGRRRSRLRELLEESTRSRARPEYGVPQPRDPRYGPGHPVHSGQGHPGQGYPDPRWPAPGYPPPNQPAPRYPSPQRPTQGNPAPGRPAQGYPNPQQPAPGYPDRRRPDQGHPDRRPPEQEYRDQWRYGPGYTNPGYPGGRRPHRPL